MGSALHEVVLTALRSVDGCCLDTDEERERVADVVTTALAEHFKQALASLTKKENAP